MSKYEATGTVEFVGPVETIGNNGFTKRDLVIIEERQGGGTWPNYIAFSLKMDKCSIGDGLKKGDTVRVKFTVDGRKWEGPKGTRYFSNLTAWQVTGGTGATGGANAQSAAMPALTAEDESDLPF